MGHAAVFLLLSCFFPGCAVVNMKNDEGLVQYMPEIRLSANLEPGRPEFERLWKESLRDIGEFALKNGWKRYLRDPFASRVEIYDDRKSFQMAVTGFLKMSPVAEFPETYSACLENGVLSMVSPDLYAKGYPEGIEADSYKKLVVHELAHRLHIRILNGNEDAMGPVWFFEGFAVYAAGQFASAGADISPLRAKSVIESRERGSYRDYGSIFKRLAEKAPLIELLRRADDQAFMRGLLE